MTLADLERSFDPAYNTTAAMEALVQDAEAGQDGARRPDRREMPVDVLLANSMLQVGATYSASA